MSFVARLTKYFIYTFSFLLFICALVLIIFGILYFVLTNGVLNVFSNLGNYSFGIFSICLGIIIIFVVTCGLYVGLQQTKRLLTIFGITLVGLLILQLVFAALALAHIANHQDNVDQLVTDLFMKMALNEDNDATAAFDNLQKQFSCCGIMGPDDYETSFLSIPASCYKTPTSSNIPYQDGCALDFGNTIEPYIQVISYVAIAFVPIELLAAIYVYLVRRYMIRSRLKSLRS